MAGRIQQQASVGEAGKVLDLCLVDKERALRNSPNKLTKGFQTSEGSPDSVGQEETLLIIYSQGV